jgi:WD40 repeat protein
MDFRPGGDLLLLLSDDGDRLFVRDWRQDKYLEWANDIPKVGAARWSPDGKWLAIGYRSGVVQVREVPDGRIFHEVIHPGTVSALAFSPDGRYLAIGGTVVRIMSVSSGKLLPNEWKHPQVVDSMLFNQAGDRLIAACGDKKARVFAVDGGQTPLFDPLPHETALHRAPVLVDKDRRLITVSSFGPDGGKLTELSCWDMETGKLVGPGVIPTRIRVSSGVVASPRGDWFATGGVTGPEVWMTADNGAKSVLFTEHSGRVEDFVPSPDGKTLLSASWDSTARLWSIPEGKPLGSPLPHMGVASRCAIASDNIHLATVSGGLVRVWKRFDGEIADVQSVNWKGTPHPSFDGRLIAPGTWHEMPYGFSPIGVGKLLVASASTGAAVGPAIALRGQLVDSCVCADNRTVAAVSDDKGIGWLLSADVYTGQAVEAPKRLPGSPRSVAARPSTSHVAVLCGGGELPVFDYRNGEQILSLNHDGQTAWRNERVEYTADGNTLVTLTEGRGGEQLIHIRDAETGRPRCPPIRPVLKGGPLRSFALSADSRLLATAVNGKNAAQVWDLETGRALSQPLPHPGDNYGLFCLCFSPDGRHLLTGCTDGQARLWDWQAGTLACPPLKHDDQVLSVAITHDGRYALTSGRLQASKLHVWELTTGKLVAPRIPLPIHATARIACFGTESHVVASSAFVGSVARVDLAKLLTPPEMSIEDYRLLGELASGQRIEQGDESGLTQDEWLQRLNLFNQRHLGHGWPGPAAAAMRLQDWNNERRLSSN